MIRHKLSDEPARLASLQRYDVLDTPADGIFEKITSLVSRVLKVPVSAVTLVDSDRQWVKSIHGMAARDVPRSASFCAQAIKPVKPLVIPDAAADSRFRTNPLVLGPPGIRSYAGAPLQTPDGYNIGALCVMDMVPRRFSDAELDILSRFAALVVDELELRRIAERDCLTHALSRRGFIGQVERELKRFDRSRHRSVLAVMDIDHFTAINTEFGHLAGDAALRDIAATAIYQLRATDAFGRLGGEEFGILLSGTDEPGGRTAIDKIRRAVEESIVPIADGIGITASFGAVALRGETASAESWIAKAYEALYRAKHSGRNRCVFATPNGGKGRRGYHSDGCGEDQGGACPPGLSASALSAVEPGKLPAGRQPARRSATFPFRGYRPRQARSQQPHRTESPTPRATG